MRFNSDVYIKTYEMIIFIANICNFDSNSIRNIGIRFDIRTKALR